MPFLGGDLRDVAPGLRPPAAPLPLTDPWAWKTFAAHNWIYNRLELVQRQGVPCGPLPVQPPTFPVFAKPMMNLWGGGRGAGTLKDKTAWKEALPDPALFWMPMLEGRHISVDAIIDDRGVAALLPMEGHPIGDGMFDHWRSVPLTPAVAEAGAWLAAALPGYRGVLNFELIGDVVIEAHLRLGDLDRCGQPAVLQRVVDVYDGASWAGEVHPFTVFALFGPATPIRIDPAVQDWAAQFTDTCDFEHDDEPEVLPKGGRRLVYFSTRDHELGLEVRQRIVDACAPPLPTRFVSSLEVPRSQT